MMNIRHLGFALAVTAFGAFGAFGCGKKGEDKLDTKPLGDSGFVIDAPSDWTVKAEMKGFWSVEAPDRHGGFVQVMINDGPGATETLDDMAKNTSCTDATKAIKEKTPAGTMFVQCEAEAGSMGGKPIIAQRIRATASTDKANASCHIDTDKNVELSAKICKSLRAGTAAPAPAAK